MLIGSAEVLFPPIGSEDTIVGMVLLDGDTTLCGIRFKAMFASKSRIGVNGGLMIYLNESGSAIDKDSPTTVLIVWFLLAVGVWKTAARLGDVVVHVYMLTRKKLFGG